MRSPVESYLWRLIERHSEMPDGTWTTYVEDLPPEDAQRFGISMVMVDGARHDAGDTGVVFPIQSISKVMSFAMALDRHGSEEVSRHVDVEPSGVSFNAIELDPVTGLPPNPMVNSGAIATVALLDSIDEILAGYERFAGRHLPIDGALWASEVEINHRNRAIANLLRGSGALEMEPERALRLYLGQCSAIVDCGDLAMIAATLANGGVNPVTGQQAAGYETVRGVLSVMTSCGMYDGAGQWLFSVGMPAKSSVAGAIMAVLPGRFGLSVFSPPLDENGNSIRGLAICRDVSDDMDLHMIESGRRPPSAVRARYTLRERSSKRQRSEESVAVLAEAGDRAIVFELQGELLFTEGEFVAREAIEAAADAEVLVLDFGRVRRVHHAVADLLVDLVLELDANGIPAVLSAVWRHPPLAERLRGLTPRLVADLDRALEMAEELVLSARLAPREPTHVALADHELLQGLDADAVDALQGRMQPRVYGVGDRLLQPGEPADELLLLIAGELSVTIPSTQDGADVRVGTLSAGMLLGELAVLTGEPRSGEVVADTPVQAFALPRAEFEELRDSDPALQAALLSNLARIVARRAQAMRDELALTVE